MPPDPAGRRLAAILHGDVVGSSRLMAEDEDAAIRLVTAYRQEIELLVHQHNGRLVDFHGDEFLAEFSSAVRAVQCAVEIQSVLKARNAHLLPAQRMEFRMGVQLGEVRSEGERLFGVGVSIAARLQSLAEPGGVCISGTVQAELRNRIDLSYLDLGDQQVKNIPEPVHAYAVHMPEGRAVPPRGRRYWIAALCVTLVAGGLAFWLARRSPEMSPAFDRSIAVLPFTTIGETAPLESYASGLTEELRNVLTGYQELRTITGGQAADAALSGLTESPNASYVVNGNVQRLGDQLRIRMRLVRATDSQSTWAQTYDVSEDKLTTDPSTLISTIGRNIRFQLVQDHQRETVRRKSRSAEAADLICAAQDENYRVNQRGGYDPRAWLSNARRAVALDSNLAEGYQQISLACAVLFVAGEMSWQEGSTCSHAALDEALRIDPRDPITLLDLALVETVFDLDYRSAEARLAPGLRTSRICRNGTSRNPKNPLVPPTLSLCLS